MEQTGQRFINLDYLQFIQWSRLVRDLSVYSTSSPYSGADWSEIYQCTVLPVHTLEQTGQRLINLDCTSRSYSKACRLLIFFFNLELYFQFKLLLTGSRLVLSRYDYNTSGYNSFIEQIKDEEMMWK